MVDELLAREAYSVPATEKDPLLLGRLRELTGFHRQHCPPYRRAVDLLWEQRAIEELADIPFLPVGLFKTHRLVSVPDDEIFKTLTSSGTTGQEVSRIYLDRTATARQTRALASVMTGLLGQGRRPMIVVDSRETVRDRRTFGARAAGILGMSTFGRDHLYALNADMTLDRDSLREWLGRHQGDQLLLFGFTFMVWQHFLAQLEPGEIDLSQAVLVHSGGWKKLEEEAVGNAEFKEALAASTGLTRVANFYGMVEQIGTVYLECESGRLHAPNFAEVIVRDPETWQEVPFGEPGLVQVVSALPESYPGHSILTEDRARLTGRDDCSCGWLGSTVELLGRLPRAELRGCSDTHAAEQRAA